MEQKFDFGKWKDLISQIDVDAAKSGKTVYTTKEKKVDDDMATLEKKIQELKKKELEEKKKKTDSLEFQIFDESFGKRETIFETLDRLKYEVGMFHRDMKLLETDFAEFESSKLKSSKLFKKMENFEEELEKLTKKETEEEKKQKKDSRDARITSLNQRLVHLEEIVGISLGPKEEMNNISDAMSDVERRLNLVTKKKDILELVQEKIKVVNLEIQKIENFRKKSLSIAKKLMKSEDEFSEVENTPKDIPQKKVDEVYQKVQNWEIYKDLLPLLIKRLESLKDVQSNIVDIENITNGFDENLKTLKENVKSNTEIIEKTKKEFEEAKDNLNFINTKLDSELDLLFIKLQKVDILKK